MKVVIVEPDKAPYVAEIRNTLKAKQEIVGGLIEAIYPFEDGEIALICNEEGKINRLPLNRALRDSDGRIYDIIAGTFLICSAPSDSENFAGLNDQQIAKYLELFRRPEKFAVDEGKGQKLIPPYELS